MKRVLSILFFLLAGLLILAGCGGGETAVSPVVEPEVETNAVSEAPPSEPAAGTPHDKYNLSLIGNTGRPQFLNAYASW